LGSWSSSMPSWYLLQLCFFAFSTLPVGQIHVVFKKCKLSVRSLSKKIASNLCNLMWERICFRFWELNSWFQLQFGNWNPFFMFSLIGFNAKLLFPLFFFFFCIPKNKRGTHSRYT
jgi:hypothetical protein